MPSDAAVRTYCALNRDLTYRRTENKEAAKQNAENFVHVQSFEQRLREVGKRHPGIFDDPNRLWNMDETQVDGEFGHRRKSFSSASSNHGGYSVVRKGSGKHLTAILNVSASGQLAPLFAIAAGKSVMVSWTRPLPKVSFVDDEGVPHWLADQGWMPNDTVVRCTKNGSVDMTTMPVLIQHIEKICTTFRCSRQGICSLSRWPFVPERN